MPLLLLTGPATSTRGAARRSPSTRGHLEADPAVVDEDLVAGARRRRAGPSYVVRADRRVAGDVAGGDRELLARPAARPGRRRTCRAGSSGPAGRRRCRPRARSRRRPRAPSGRPARGRRRLPWLRFSRATSMPASTSARISRGWRSPGPRVQTILALRTPRPYRATGRVTVPVASESDDPSADVGQTTSGRSVGGIGAGSVVAAGEVACRPRPRRPGPRRSPTRSATGRGRRRRRRRRPAPRSRSARRGTTLPRSSRSTPSCSTSAVLLRAR